MKSIKERINSNPKEQQDDTDGSVNYDKLNEERLPGEDFETDENTGETEFYNPVFKPRPVYNSNLGVEENYDQLNFTPRSTPKASPNLPRKQQVNAEKQNEDIEMMGVKAGVNNYGYIHERKRPDSWESDLSAINPISTAIRNPVNIPSRRIPSVGMEMSESPPRDYSNSVSKQSAYSSVANNSNPYLMSGDKDPQYEVLPRVQANKQALEPRPSGGNKKINMLYESAVITEKSASSEKYRKRTSIDQEAASYDEGSNCCHLLFTILTGILAIVALVIVFLMVFGVINPNCKDCDSSASTSVRAQSVDIQLKELSANLTQLKNDLHTNSSDVITSLRKELEDQKALVASLTQQLETQKQFTEQLNSTIRNVTIIEGEKGPLGPIGPAGLNGSKGDPGQAGTSVSSCVYTSRQSEGTSITINVNTPNTVNLQNQIVISASCSSDKQAFIQLTTLSSNLYRCQCTRVVRDGSDLTCFIHYWLCPA